MKIDRVIYIFKLRMIFFIFKSSSSSNVVNFKVDEFVLVFVYCDVLI